MKISVETLTIRRKVGDFKAIEKMIKLGEEAQNNGNAGKLN